MTEPIKEALAKRPMKLMLCTLFYERKGWSPYISSLVKTVCLLNTLGVDFDYGELSEDSYVDRARNTVGNHILNHKEFTDLIFIDSDEEWNLEGFAEPAQIGCGLGGAGYPCKNVWDFYSCIINTHEDGRPIIREDGLISAGGIPGGFMKIRRTVFEQLAEKMPDNTYEAFEPDNPEKMLKLYNFFGRIQPMGEDISFCYRWRSTGCTCGYSRT